jgi:hypothetical protein
MAESNLEKAKAAYLQLSDAEKLSFHKFLEEQEDKKSDEMKKMRDELFKKMEDTGKFASDYLKKLFNM